MQSNDPDRLEYSGLKVFRQTIAIALAIVGGVFISNPLHAEPAPHEHTALHEIDFMQHGSDLHLLSQRMAEACTQRASDAEVLELCSKMVTAHQNDRMQLQSWLQSWYGDDYEPRISEVQHTRLEQLEGMTGEEFERRFLMDMTALHMVMIKDGAMCEAQFYNGELINYCQASIVASADEIHMMRNMLCDSYGVCSLKMTPNPILDQPHHPFDMGADDTDGSEEEDGGNG